MEAVKENLSSPPPSAAPNNGRNVSRCAAKLCGTSGMRELFQAWAATPDSRGS